MLCEGGVSCATKYGAWGEVGKGMLKAEEKLEGNVKALHNVE